jgi:hypothetical protein
MMKSKHIDIRIDEETFTVAKALSPEGNISMWIRGLIRKEIESQQQKEKATD